VPRLVARLGGGSWGAGAWGDTTVSIPDGSWTDVLTGEPVAGGSVSVETLLRRFPVAVLHHEADGADGANVTGEVGVRGVPVSGRQAYSKPTSTTANDSGVLNKSGQS
jgi:hypothetical protein